MSVINAWHCLLVNNSIILMTTVNFCLISYPLVQSSSVGRDENIFVWTLCIPCIVHLWRVDFWAVKCHMYDQDAFDVQKFLSFPALALATYFAFSLLFPFFYNLSLFSFYSRVCLSFKLPFSAQRSLVSSSRSCFFSCSSMVDYSAVRIDCPSIAFLFARLGCLLKSIKGECLK